jgi:hypothetical protein
MRENVPEPTLIRKLRIIHISTLSIEYIYNEPDGKSMMLNGNSAMGSRVVAR